MAPENLHTDVSLRNLFERTACDHSARQMVYNLAAAFDRLANDLTFPPPMETDPLAFDYSKLADALREVAERPVYGTSDYWAMVEATR
jgi:hypothetical protein